MTILKFLQSHTYSRFAVLAKAAKQTIPCGSLRLFSEIFYHCFFIYLSCFTLTAASYLLRILMYSGVVAAQSVKQRVSDQEGGYSRNNDASSSSPKIYFSLEAIKQSTSLWWPSMTKDLQAETKIGAMRR